MCMYGKVRQYIHNVKTREDVWERQTDKKEEKGPLGMVKYSTVRFRITSPNKSTVMSSLFDCKQDGVTFWIYTA